MDSKKKYKFNLEQRKLTAEEQREWATFGKAALDENTGVDPLTGDVYIEGKKVNKIRAEKTFMTGQQSHKLDQVAKSQSFIGNRIRSEELMPVDTERTREESFWRLMHSFWVENLDNTEATNEDFVNYVIKYG